jgi:hypothetical protein
LAQYEMLGHPIPIYPEPAHRSNVSYRPLML